MFQLLHLEQKNPCLTIINYYSMVYCSVHGFTELHSFPHHAPLSTLSPVEEWSESGLYNGRVSCCCCLEFRSRQSSSAWPELGGHDRRNYGRMVHQTYGPSTSKPSM